MPQRQRRGRQGKKKGRPMAIKTLELPIRGMSCASCVAKIESALSQSSGVTEATVNLATERATVRYGDGATPTALVKAVRDQGYEVPAETATIPVRGMSCASCVAKIEGGLGARSGVLSASVNFAAERVT